MTEFDQTIFDDSLIGADGPDIVEASSNDAPWRLDEVRIDAIQGTIPPFKPAASETIKCLFEPTPGAADHLERAKAVARYRRYSGDVAVYDSQGRAYYREDHEGIDGRQLALLAPLAADATGFDPSGRPDQGEAMWVVVTEVDDTTTSYEAGAVLDVEVALIARRAEYPTRSEVRDEFERNGF